VTHDRIAAVEEPIEPPPPGTSGMGAVLARKLFLGRAGSLDGCASPAKLAAYAGLAPSPETPAVSRGHRLRPHRYRGLRGS
jgi:hypothetical protein